MKSMIFQLSRVTYVQGSQTHGPPDVLIRPVSSSIFPYLYIFSPSAARELVFVQNAALTLIWVWDPCFSVTTKNYTLGTIVDPWNVTHKLNT